jgi:hypothetical protein
MMMTESVDHTDQFAFVEIIDGKVVRAATARPVVLWDLFCQHVPSPKPDPEDCDAEWRDYWVEEQEYGDPKEAVARFITDVREKILAADYRLWAHADVRHGFGTPVTVP